MEKISIGDCVELVDVDIAPLFGINDPRKSVPEYFVANTPLTSLP